MLFGYVCLVTYNNSNVCVSALGINVRFCFGFTAAKPVAAEAAKIAAEAWQARQLD